jgi:hypothetical protein
MNIDKQRIDAVRMLQALGYTYQDGEWLLTYRRGEWLAPAGAAATPLTLMAKADAMHGALMRRADALAGCAEGLEEEIELNKGHRRRDRGLRGHAVAAGQRPEHPPWGYRYPAERLLASLTRALLDYHREAQELS